MTLIDKYGRKIVEEVTVKSAGKRLDNVLNLSSVLYFPADEIASMWKQHYEQKPLHVSMAMSSGHYEMWFERAKRRPLALIPMFDEDLVTNYLVEHRFEGGGMSMEIGVCRLEDYKLYGASAPPTITVNAYGDLLRDKRLALLSGSFDDSQRMTRMLALSLLVGTSEAYGRLFEWIERFTSEPQLFDYHTYLAAYKAMLPALAKQ